MDPTALGGFALLDVDPNTPPPPPLDAANFDRRVLAERVARGWWCPFPHTPASLLEQRCKDGAEARKLLNECAPIRNLADEDGVVASLLLHDSSQHTRIASSAQANPGPPSPVSPFAASAVDPATPPPPPEYYHLATYHALQQRRLPLHGRLGLGVPGIEFQNQTAAALDSDPEPRASYVRFSRDPAAAPFFMVAIRETPAAATALAAAETVVKPTKKWKRRRWYHYTLDFYLDADAVNHSLRAGVPGAARAVRRLLRSHRPIPSPSMLSKVASASLSPPLLTLWCPTWSPAPPQPLPSGPALLNSNSGNTMLVTWLVHLEADPYVLPVSQQLSTLVRQPHLRIGPRGVLFNLEIGDWAEHDVWSTSYSQPRVSSPTSSRVVPVDGEEIRAGAIFSPLSEDLFLSIAQLARVRPGRLDSVTATVASASASDAFLAAASAATTGETPASSDPSALRIVAIWSIEKYRATTWDQIRDADLVLVAPAVIMHPDYRAHIASLVGETEYHGPGPFRGSRGGSGEPASLSTDMSLEQYEFSELLAERVAALNAAGSAAYGPTRGEVIFERVWFHRVFLLNSHERTGSVAVDAWRARVAEYNALLSKRSRAGERGLAPALAERIGVLQPKVTSYQLLCGLAGSFKYAVVLPPQQKQLSDGFDFKDWVDCMPARALRAHLQHLPLGDALPDLPHADWVGFMQRATRMTTTTTAAAAGPGEAAAPSASASAAVDPFVTSVVVAVVPTVAKLLLAHDQAALFFSGAASSSGPGASRGGDRSTSSDPTRVATATVAGACAACRLPMDRDLVSRANCVSAPLDDLPVSIPPSASVTVTSTAPSHPAAAATSSSETFSAHLASIGETFPAALSTSLGFPPLPPPPPTFSASQYGTKLAAILEYIVQQQRLYEQQQPLRDPAPDPATATTTAVAGKRRRLSVADHRRGPRTVVWTQFPDFAALLVAALAERGIRAIDGTAAGHPAAAAASEAACRAFERLDTATAASVICLNPETYLYRCAALAVSHVVFAHPLLATTETAAHDLEMRVLAAVAAPTPATTSATTPAPAPAPAAAVSHPEQATGGAGADEDRRARVIVARFVASVTVEVALTERRTRALW
ncbi:hypothetical protein H9P43_000161 [Blastocladiella emersonii ATCC 22665]|nr:hypothetical protein H9P43_000161 [Blastocladiella emersonii ATCC 22665]